MFEYLDNMINLPQDKWHSLRSKLVFVLAFDFHVYIQMDDRSINLYKNIHQLLYESIKRLKFGVEGVDIYL